MKQAVGWSWAWLEVGLNQILRRREAVVRAVAPMSATWMRAHGYILPPFYQERRVLREWRKRISGLRGSR